MASEIEKNKKIKTLSIQDAAKYIEMDRRALSIRIKLGDNPDHPDILKFPHDHFGNQVVIMLPQLEAYVKGNWEASEKDCPDKWHRV